MTQFQVAHAGNTEVQQMEGVAALLSQSATPGVAVTGVLYGLSVAQQSTANGTVSVSVGAGVVQGSLTAGASLLINDAAYTLDIFTANPMGALARNDIVVFDALTRSVSAIIGAPNATPTDPTIPATSLPLARLRHNASDTTIPAAQIDDLRSYTVLFNQPIRVTSLAARNALTPTQGMRVIRMDVAGNPVETYDTKNSSWWGNTTQTLTPASNFSNPPTGYSNLTFAVSGKVAMLTGHAAWVSGAGGGLTLTTIPTPYWPAYDVAFTSVSQNNSTGAIGTTYRGVVAAANGIVALSPMGVAQSTQNVIPIQATWLIA